MNKNMIICIGIFFILCLINLFVSLSHPRLQHCHIQNTLTSDVRHNGLASADRLTLGVVKVWGAGSVDITNVTLTDATGISHDLIPQHNTGTQVRNVSACLVTIVNLKQLCKYVYGSSYWIKYLNRL